MSTKASHIETKMAVDSETLKNQFLASLPPLSLEEHASLEMYRKEISKREDEFEKKLISEDSLLQEIIELSSKPHIKNNFEQARDQEIVLFIGKTGSGKSTVINFLRGVQYSVRGRGRLKAEISHNPGIKDLAETGEELTAVTLCPKTYSTNFQESQLRLTDFPGLRGIRGNDAQRIFESLSSQIVINNAKAIKSVIITFDYTLMVRGGEFTTLIEDLSKFLEKNAIEKLPFIFLINKVFEDETEAKKEVFRVIDECKKYFEEKLKKIYESRMKHTEKQNKNWISKRWEFLAEYTKITGPTKEVEENNAEIFSKCIILLNMVTEQDTILLDIRQDEDRDKILKKILEKKANHEVRKIFDFSQYDEIRIKYDIKFVKQVEFSSQILACLAIKSIIEEKRRGREAIKTNLELCEGILKNVRKIEPSDRKVEEQRLKNIIETINKQIIHHNKIKEGREREKRDLEDERSRIIDVPDRTISRPAFEEERTWVPLFNRLGFSVHHIRYGDNLEEADKPFYGCAIDLTNRNTIPAGRLYEDPSETSERIDGNDTLYDKYHAIYISVLGQKGYCKVDFYVKNKHIKSNAMRLRAIKRDLENVQSEIEQEKRHLQSLEEHLIINQNKQNKLLDTPHDKKKSQEEIDEEIRSHNNDIEKYRQELQSLNKEIETQEIDYYSSIQILRMHGRFFEGVKNLILRLQIDKETEKKYLELYFRWEASLKHQELSPTPSPEKIFANSPSFTEIEKLSKEDPVAKYKLGLCYVNGDEVKQNFEEAFKCFKEAHVHKNLDATFHLALCHLRGQGTKRDSEVAIELLSGLLDLEYSNPLAIHMLALCHENGEGTKQDVKRAHELYKKALEIFKDSSSDEDAEKLFYCGFYFEFGNGTKIDEKLAVNYYIKS